MSQVNDFDIPNPWEATRNNNPHGPYPNGWFGDTRDLCKNGPPGIIVDFDPSWAIDTIVHQGITGDRWDGTFAAVVKLVDGRFITFATFYGPTGSGFSGDAYGGDAEVLIHPNLGSALAFGLTDEWRRVFLEGEHADDES